MMYLVSSRDDLSPLAGCLLEEFPGELY